MVELTTSLWPDRVTPTAVFVTPADHSASGRSHVSQLGRVDRLSD
jgi:hypothetical protein